MGDSRRQSHQPLRAPGRAVLRRSGTSPPSAAPWCRSQHGRDRLHRVRPGRHRQALLQQRSFSSPIRWRQRVNDERSNTNTSWKNPSPQKYWKYGFSTQRLGTLVNELIEGAASNNSITTAYATSRFSPTREPESRARVFDATERRIISTRRRAGLARRRKTRPKPQAYEPQY